MPSSRDFHATLGRLRLAGVAVEQAVERHPRVLAASALALALTAGLAGASRKEMWFDEIFTYALTRLGSLGAIHSALDSGADGNQLGYYAFTLGAAKLFGLTPLTIRLPSLVGFMAFTVCLGVYTARRCGVLTGFVAALAPFLMGTRFYSVEGRSYGLVLGFTGALLLSWQAVERGRRGGWAWLALTCMIGTFVSPLVAFSILAIAIGEIWRSAALRQIRWSFWFALSLGGLTLLMARRVASQGLERLSGCWQQFVGLPALPTIYDTYGQLLNFRPLVFKIGFVVLGGTLLIAALAKLDPGSVRARERGEGMGFPRWEIAAAAWLLATPLVLFLATRVFHQAYLPRYAMAASAGAALLAAALFARFRVDGWGGLLAAFLLVSVISSQAVQVVKQRPPSADPLDATGLGALVGTRDGPVVVVDSFRFMRDVWYARPGLRERLWLLYEPDAARRSFEKAGDVACILHLGPFWPMNVMEYGDFVRTRDRFLVVNWTHDRRWLVRRLAEEGFGISRVGTGPDVELLSVEPGSVTRGGS